MTFTINSHYREIIKQIQTDLLFVPRKNFIRWSLFVLSNAKEDKTYILSKHRINLCMSNVASNTLNCKPLSFCIIPRNIQVNNYFLC